MTNIGPAHLSELGSMEAITEAKAEILAGMRPGGAAVLNRDDPRIVGLAPRVKGRIVWYGAGGGDVQVDQVTSGPGWVRCRIRDQEGEVQATIPWDGAYQALNMAAAAAVGADPLPWVLGGGEDHALVACFGGPLPAGWRIIGRVLEGPARVLVDGDEWRGYAGWQSYDELG